MTETGGLEFSLSVMSPTHSMLLHWKMRKRGSAATKIATNHNEGAVLEGSVLQGLKILENDAAKYTSTKLMTVAVTDCV